MVPYGLLVSGVVYLVISLYLESVQVDLYGSMMAWFW